MAEGGSFMDGMWVSGGSRRALVEGAVVFAHETITSAASRG
jgi:hypothetical protein